MFTALKNGDPVWQFSAFSRRPEWQDFLAGNIR